MTTPASAATKSGRPAVLLVDDERPLLGALREGLESDFAVETAGTAEEADLMMASSSYDVLICDHMLPGEAGLEFLIRMSQRYPDTRRILLTGYMKPEMLLRSVNEAALFRYLLKPVSLNELVKVTQDAAKLYDQTVAAAAN